MQNRHQFGDLYSSLKIKDAWRFTDDLTSYTQWALDTTIVKGQVVPMIFNANDQNGSLKIQSIPGNIAAYPFIRYIDISVQKDPLNFQIQPEPNSSNFTMNFPASSTTTQTSNVSNLDRARKLLLNTIPAGVTITDIQIAPQGAIGPNVDLFPGSITAGGTVIDLESYFASTYGEDDVNQSTKGFTVKITANNTIASIQPINATLYGIQRLKQNNIWLLDYQDAHGQLHRVGTFNDMLISKTFLLDRLITVPITDPTSPNFGTLLFTLLRTNNDLYTLETYNIVVGISVAYLLTQPGY